MKCCICGNEIPVTSYGWSEGNNAQPVKDGRCCDKCNDEVVMPARIAMMYEEYMKKEEEVEND